MRTSEQGRTRRGAVPGHPGDPGRPTASAGRRCRADRPTPSRGRWPGPEAALRSQTDRTPSSPTADACPPPSTCTGTTQVTLDLDQDLELGPHRDHCQFCDHSCNCNSNIELCFQELLLLVQSESVFNLLKDLEESC